MVVQVWQDAERDKEREVMRTAKQEWQQRQMEAFRNRRQVEGERADPPPMPSPLDSPPVYAPGTAPAAHLLLCMHSVNAQHSNSTNNTHRSPMFPLLIRLVVSASDNGVVHVTHLHQPGQTTTMV